MTPCHRPDCDGGTIKSTGFCDVCGRRPLPAREPAPSGPPARTALSARAALRADGGGTIPQSRRQDVGHGDGPGPALPSAPAPSSGQALSSSKPGPRLDLLDQDGLVVLPEIRSAADPGSLLVQPSSVPSGGRPCGACPELIGTEIGGRPAPEQGYCSNCGTPYSFVPQLNPGDVVGGNYRVRGYLAHGGLGWVYLADDIHVEGLQVVLKGLINTNDAVARRTEADEVRALSTLHHRDIVRIITRFSHRTDAADRPTDYTVMEYIGGMTLEDLLGSTDLERIFGGPMQLDHVLTYGCKLLGALGYLHEQGLLYCDMKPSNVIHYGRDIKVIDFGAVRSIKDRTTPLVFTEWFSPPYEERQRGDFGVDFDLYTVARTLTRLAGRTGRTGQPGQLDWPDGLAGRSFQRIIERATDKDRSRRFQSAAEMSRQLWEVLREHRALAGHAPYPERSTRFGTSTAVFGAGLGDVPDLSYWTTRPRGPAGATEAPAQDPATAVPDPAQVAAALPEPLPDPADPVASKLPTLPPENRDAIAAQSTEDAGWRTVELALWLCRACLLHGADPDHARHWLRIADDLLHGADPDRAWHVPAIAEEHQRRLPGAAVHNWRIAWHDGLIRLTDGQVDEARKDFDAVYAALPGEAAPKLALGYCLEHKGTEIALPQARSYYNAVWQRDRAQGSAVFGLARIALRNSDRDGAAAVLDQVPTTAWHHDAAAIAAVRVYCPQLGSRKPTAAHLREAARRLDSLRLGALAGPTRDRLVAEIQQRTLDALLDGGADWDAPRHWGDDRATERLFGPLGTERQLRGLLARSLHELATQARTDEGYDDLRDHAYSVTPVTRFPPGQRRRTAPATPTGRTGRPDPAEPAGQTDATTAAAGPPAARTRWWSPRNQ